MAKQCYLVQGSVNYLLIDLTSKRHRFGPGFKKKKEKLSSYPISAQQLQLFHSQFHISPLQSLRAPNLPTSNFHHTSSLSLLTTTTLCHRSLPFFQLQVRNGVIYKFIMIILIHTYILLILIFFFNGMKFMEMIMWID